MTVAVTCWFSSDYPQLPALVARGARRTEQFIAADGLCRGRIGLSLLGKDAGQATEDQGGADRYGPDSVGHFRRCADTWMVKIPF